MQDYLQFLNKDLSTPSRLATQRRSLLTANCLTPDIFRVAAATARWKHRMKLLVNVPVRSLFTVLSRFLDHKIYFFVNAHAAQPHQ